MKSLMPSTVALKISNSCRSLGSLSGVPYKHAMNALMPAVRVWRALGRAKDAELPTLRYGCGCCDLTGNNSHRVWEGRAGGLVAQAERVPGGTGRARRGGGASEVGVGTELPTLR